VTLKPYPTPKTNVELLLSRLRGGGGDEESRMPSRLIALLRASAQNLDSLLSPPGALVMRPLVVR
jgi:hypothetical protein